ncbi:hypothetical protein TEA_020419 [Camellia sinensis var. sinensis]|uniref:Uncharacterized protein n=1 Tax=Camellia sinensis var. sinensis TaxID=542762 RepID=A0A4S4CVU6_CAMSN|nr:hypothetical protein TEA_020419 [Camellia sinensis var. sinensis]
MFRFLSSFNFCFLIITWIANDMYFSLFKIYIHSDDTRKVKVYIGGTGEYSGEKASSVYSEEASVYSGEAGVYSGEIGVNSGESSMQLEDVMQSHSLTFKPISPSSSSSLLKTMMVKQGAKAVLSKARLGAGRGKVHHLRLSRDQARRLHPGERLRRDWIKAREAQGDCLCATECSSGRFHLTTQINLIDLIKGLVIIEDYDSWTI